MLSDFNRKELSKNASDLGFIRDTFEKMSRLVRLLEYFERDPVLSKYLALKGGTAFKSVLRL